MAEKDKRKQAEVIEPQGQKEKETKRKKGGRKPKEKPFYNYSQKELEEIWAKVEQQNKEVADFVKELGGEPGWPRRPIPAPKWQTLDELKALVRKYYKEIPQKWFTQFSKARITTQQLIYAIARALQASPEQAHDIAYPQRKDKLFGFLRSGRAAARAEVVYQYLAKYLVPEFGSAEWYRRELIRLYQLAIEARKVSEAERLLEKVKSVEVPDLPVEDILKAKVKTRHRAAEADRITEHLLNPFQKRERSRAEGIKGEGNMENEGYEEEEWIEGI